MTPERWRTIERLYHEALTRDAVERAAYLAAACGGDEELRRDVESLIAHDAAAPHLLDQPAGEPLRAALVARVADRLSIPGSHAGRVLGAYELQTLLGAGGMGEVYRAVDTRLHRTVAIKILPPHVSHDPDRRRQLTREAQIISSLSHPHICTIHDIGLHDGLDYIVMEYIEGETLQQRLLRGALPWSRAIEYAAQIADALDKAHRRGIVHRDLKPGNVMLTPAGVKLLDFGIATRAAAADGVLGPADQRDDDRPSSTARSRADAVDASVAPSIAALMATPQYASPEQLEGRRVDARTDLFSFGAVVHEMMFGRPAFDGDTHTALVESILHGEPSPIRDVVPAVPTRLARTLARCLAKDADERWQTASDLLFELRSIAISNQDEPPPPRASWLPAWAERALWSAAVVTALLALFVVGSLRAPERATADAPDIRFDLWPAAGTRFWSGFDVPFALAPDGRSLAFVAAGGDGVARVWVRRLNGANPQAHEIRGTEDANTPFWSPDGEWIGFFSRQRLLKARVSTGRVQVIATRVSTLAGASWNADGVILFAAGPGGLSRVSADGGPHSLATREEGSHFWPLFLPDGKHFLYAAVLPREIRLGSLTGEPARTLMRVPVRISSLGYASGHLFYGQDDSLFARVFNESTLEFAGDPVRVLPDIPITQLGRMPFSVSAGTLVFWPYPGSTPARLQWLDDEGHADTVVDTPARYVGLTLSPDDRRAAFSRRNADGGADVWIRDLGGATESQLTFDGMGFAPRWSADRGRLAWTMGKQPPPKLFIKSLDTAGVDTPISSSPLPTFVSSWCHDGARMVSVRIDPETHDDLYIEDLRSGHAERLPINSAGNDYQGTVSPDDRWLAYVTDDAGRDEVWIASFPSGGIRRQVSIEGGTSPQWTANGREVAFISTDKRLTIRSFASTGAGIALGSPRALFDASLFVDTTPLVTPSANAYSAAATGRRFLAAIRATDVPVPPMQVIVNWRTLLPQ